MRLNQGHEHEAKIKRLTWLKGMTRRKAGRA